jgi:hypothetical protein
MWAPIRGSSGGTTPSYDAVVASDPGAQLPASTEPAAWAPDDPAFEAHVLRAFIRDGRLASIPARERKKLVIYRYLVDRAFPVPDEVIHERDVNMRLALWHPDVATIRRALVERGFVTRDGMSYRRAVPLRPGEP